MKPKSPKKTINSLYIHIPFCKNICPYCDFPKLLLKANFHENYIKTLIYELNSLKINHKVKSIYIGGGTPTSVSLTPLLKVLGKYIDKNTEFTIEGNLLDLNKKLLSEYKKYKVNRLSLGVQSTNDKILKILGREHNRKDVFNKIKLAKSYFKNINIDLIYGFKELNIKTLKEILNDYVSLKVKHISTYSLEIHPGTKFYNDKRKELDPSKIRKQFDVIYEALTKNKFIRYEISNFALPSFESQHNQVYWRDEEYYGIGLGAASFVNNIRYKNTLNIKNYLNKNFISTKEEISLEDDKKYYLMLNLRLSKGINLIDYKNRFSMDLLTEKNKEINNLINRNLLKIENNYLITTYEGSMLLDIILRELF